MNTKVMPWSAIVITTILLLSACGVASPPAPTAIPPTPTPEGPKAGHWEGDDISFTVTNDNKIVDFEFVIPNACTITVNAITIDDNGKFAVSQDYDFSNATDPVSLFLKQTLGEKGSLDIISGQFTSPTEANGDHQDIFFCETQVMMGDFPGSEWTAQWTEP